MLPELSEWPNESEAAKTLAVSAKTVLRYAQAGKIELRKRERRGLKPENVFNPADIQRLQPQAHVMPPEDIARPDAGAIARTGMHKGSAGEILAFIRTIATAIETERQNVQIPKLWLSLREASAISGLSRKFLLQACVEGRLPSVMDGRRRRICRASLEAFAG